MVQVVLHLLTSIFRSTLSDVYPNDTCSFPYASVLQAGIIFQAINWLLFFISQNKVMWEFFTILGSTTLMASSLRRTGQKKSFHHQNLAPWPKTAIDIAKILFATFYFIP